MSIEEKVYNYITTNHVGKENMIKNRELRAYFPQIKSDKAMRKIIQNIRCDPKFTIFIGSESGKTGGYFACTSRVEINDTINNHIRRAYKMYRECEIFRSKEVIEYAKR